MSWRVLSCRRPSRPSLLVCRPVTASHLRLLTVHCTRLLLRWLEHACQPRLTINALPPPRSHHNPSQPSLVQLLLSPLTLCRIAHNLSSLYSFVLVMVPSAGICPSLFAMSAPLVPILNGIPCSFPVRVLTVLHTLVLIYMILNTSLLASSQPMWTLERRVRIVCGNCCLTVCRSRGLLVGRTFRY